MSQKLELGVPYSRDAEQAVLGSLMLDNRAFDDVVDQVSSADFYFAAHKRIFECITALANAGSPFDAMILSDALQDRGELENVGGLMFLVELIETTPSAANISGYLDIIAQKSKLRRLLDVSHDIQTQVSNPGERSASEITDDVEQQIFDISESQIKNQSVSVTESLAAMLEDLDRRFNSESDLNGLSTGFTDLDKDTGGLEKGSLIILAARPSMGKTSLAMNLCEQPIFDGKCVVVFSLEMPHMQISQRLASAVGRVPLNRIRNPKEMTDDDWPKLTTAFSLLKDRKLEIDDTAGLSPMQMRARCRRYAKKMGGIDLIVVDYLQLMNDPSVKNNRTEEISKISRALKQIAKEFDCPVIALSQLNRQLEQRPNKRPVMSDLRESGAIEQDADLILFVYRDEVYDEDSPDKGVAEIIRAKNRNGEIGTTRLAWRGEYTRFANLAPQHYS